MTEVSEAEALIAARMPAAGAERVSLEDADGRVLAEDVRAERDIPAFDRVTMDGIAVASQDIDSRTRRFEVVGVQAAGAPSMCVERPGQCVRVMTGAVLPAGADTVIPVERVEIGDGWARVAEDAVIEARQFVHHRGTDRREGAKLLGKGTRIGPPEMAVLASNGTATPLVARSPRVAVISTGDELVGVDERIEPYQIRSSNGRAIESCIRAHALGRPARRRLRDDETEILEAIEALHESSDVLVLSGGVSMGKFDFVPAVLARLGMELVFHKIEQKPGRPMWFGVSRDGKPIFALPGNPVSTLVCMRRYVVPALQQSLGLAPRRSEFVTLAAESQALPRMTHFLPVFLSWEADGRARAEPRPTNTSGDFSSLAGTDGFVELVASAAPYPAGTPARFFGW